MINEKFEKLFGNPARAEDEPLTQQHMDIAASIQSALDHIMVSLTRGIAAEYGGGSLCLAGGVALNCVSNAKNTQGRPVQGDMGPAGRRRRGRSRGAALAAYHIFLGQARTPRDGKDGMSGTYLGPPFPTPRSRSACAPKERSSSRFPMRRP